MLEMKIEPMMIIKFTIKDDSQQEAWYTLPCSVQRSVQHGLRRKKWSQITAISNKPKTMGLGLTLSRK